MILTLLFALGCVGLGRWITDRWTADFDPAARWGLGGLVGLGAIGVLTFFIGLLPGGLRWGIAPVGLLALMGLFLVVQRRSELGFRAPSGPWLLAPIALGIGALISLVGVLVPSTALDWDSIAYQLAVPKLWVQAGQITFISFIHHSNFPMATNLLYVWGLQWGDQSGAKAFSLAFGLLGSLTLFGVARQRYGAAGAWLAPTAFSLTPLAIWLSGTAYVDVTHGLYAGLAILFAAWWAAEPERLAYRNLSALMLALACATKFTGLQTAVAIGLVLLIAGAAGRSPAVVRGAFLIGILGIAGGAPWMVRNMVNTGNPVYPFFYSVLGGKNWDAFSEKIYRQEQQTFGAGRERAAPEQPDYTANPLRPERIGHAVLGLAYQPGRYINPRPTDGMGLAIGSLGFAGLLAGLLWAFSGRVGRFEGVVLGVVLVSLAMWFVLSQQARYIVTLQVPLAVLAAGLAATPSFARNLIQGAVGVQAVVSLAIANLYLVSPPDANPERPAIKPLQVALGQVSRTEYLAQNLGFFEPAGQLNVVAREGKVALFDEVFGFYLDVPYFWANPGHTTELGYAEMKDGNDLGAALRRLGISHAYLNLTIYPPADPAVQRWRAAMGLDGPIQPWTDEERERMSQDLREKWKMLFADAVARGQLIPATGVGPRKLVFRVAEGPSGS